MDTTGKKEKRTSTKNLNRRSTRNHGNEEFQTKSMEKQSGMKFGFRKTATAVRSSIEREIVIPRHTSRQWKATALPCISTTCNLFSDPRVVQHSKAKWQIGGWRLKSYRMNVFCVYFKINGYMQWINTIRCPC